MVAPGRGGFLEARHTKECTDLERTWDGIPVSKDSPHGAAVVVYRRGGQQLEFLVLHRNIYGPEYEGDWAWGPPSGARQPGESVDQCAAREMLEETGLALSVRRIDTDSSDWAFYTAEAPPQAQVRLSVEHDRCAWLPLDQAAALVTPERVRAQLVAAAQVIGRA